MFTDYIVYYRVIMILFAIDVVQCMPHVRAFPQVTPAVLRHRVPLKRIHVGLGRRIYRALFAEYADDRNVRIYTGD